MTYYAVQEWTGVLWRGTGTHFHDLPRMQQEIAWLQKTYPGARYRIAIMDGYTMVDTAPLTTGENHEHLLDRRG